MNDSEFAHKIVEEAKLIHLVSRLKIQGGDVVDDLYSEGFEFVVGSLRRWRQKYPKLFASNLSKQLADERNALVYSSLFGYLRSVILVRKFELGFSLDLQLRESSDGNMTYSDILTESDNDYSYDFLPESSEDISTSEEHYKSVFRKASQIKNYLANKNPPTKEELRAAWLKSTYVRLLNTR